MEDKYSHMIYFGNIMQSSDQPLEVKHVQSINLIAFHAQGDNTAPHGIYIYISQLPQCFSPSKGLPPAYIPDNY